MSYVNTQIHILEKILLRIFDTGSAYFTFTVYTPNSKVPNLYDNEQESFKVMLRDTVKLNDVYFLYLNAIMSRLPNTNIAITTTVRNNCHYYTRTIYVQPRYACIIINHLVNKLDKTNTVTIPERYLRNSFSKSVV